MKQLQLLIFILSIFIVSPTSFGAVSNIETSVNYDQKWVFSAFSLANLEGGEMQEGGASWFAYNYVSAVYRVDYGKNIGFRVPFIYNSAGFDDFNDDEVQAQKISLHNLLIDYTDNNLVMLPGEIEVYWRGRIGLPTSQASRDQRQIGSYRNDFILNKTLAPRLDLEYWPIFQWNIHTQTAYENEFGSASNTRAYELDHRITLWHRPHHSVAIGWYLGAEDAWYNRSKTNTTTRQTNNRMSEHLLKTGPAVRFSIGSNFNFIFNLSNKVQVWGYAPDRTQGVSDLAKFNAEQTEFTLLSFIRF